MKKIQRQKHPLARAREILGIGQKRALEYLGIPEGTCARIESGRTNDGKPYPFTHKCASHVSAWTGIAEGCLLSKRPGAKIVTVDGEPFTPETYARVAAERDTVLNPALKSGDETFAFFLMLIAKLGRFMLAAPMDTVPQRRVVWQLRSEIYRLGSTLPAWEGKELEDGQSKNPTLPERFDASIQKLFILPSGKRVSLAKVGATILQEFNRYLYTSNYANAKAARRPTAPALRAHVPGERSRRHS